VIALAVNVAAAAVLLPHRHGDANVRGSLAVLPQRRTRQHVVVVAAGLVAWTGTAWPDLVVAVVIAGLFLHSSWAILRDARSDLRDASKLPTSSAAG
jgi:Co/Zn/Cd efflux system component